MEAYFVLPKRKISRENEMPKKAVQNSHMESGVSFL